MLNDKKIATLAHPPAEKHVVIVVHGIRTLADWIHRLRNLLHKEKSELDVEEFYFGYFSSFLFIFPWFRKPATERYAAIVLNRLHQLEGNRIDVVAHSFGTLIVATALERLKREAPTPLLKPRVQNLILAGSVLKHEFPWREYCPTLVNRITNDCGTRDVPLLLCMLFLIGLGYGGRRGFDAIHCEHFQNRFFQFGHSGFFKRNGEPYDDFMRDYWLPILLSDAPVKDVPDPRTNERFSRLIAWLETWADPIKILVHIILFVAPFSAGWWMYASEREARSLAQANLEAAHSLTEISVDGSSGLQAALRAVRDYDSVEINSALKANLDIASVPAKQLLYDSSSGIALAAAHPKERLVALGFSKSGNFVVSIVDVNVGKEIGNFFSANSHGASCNISGMPSTLRFSSSGTYVLLESPFGICVWSVKEKHVIFSDHLKSRIEILPNDRSAILIDSDSIENPKNSVYLIDLPSGKIQRLGSRPSVLYDDIKVSPRGMVFTNYEKLIIQNFSSKSVYSFRAKEPGYFIKLFVSKSGKIAIGATNLGEIIAASTDSGHILWKKGAGTELKHVDFSSDEKLIALQFSTGTSSVWRSTDGFEIRSLNATGLAEGIQFIGNSSQFVITCNRHHDLKIWDITTGTLWRKVPADLHQFGFAVTADGRYIVGGAPDGMALIWDLNQPGSDARRTFSIDSQVHQMALNATGERMLILGEEGEVAFWDVRANISRNIDLRSELGPTLFQPISIDRQGTFAIVESRNGTIKSIDLNTGKELWRYAVPRLFSVDSQIGKDGIPYTVKTALLFKTDEIALPVICPSKSPLIERENGVVKSNVNVKTIGRICDIDSIDRKVFPHQISTQIFRGSIRISPSGKLVLVPFLDLLVVLNAQDGKLNTVLSTGFDPHADDLFSLPLGAGLRFARLREVDFLKDDSIVGITHGNMIWKWQRKENGFADGRVLPVPSSSYFEALSPWSENAYFYDTKNENVIRFDLSTMETNVIDHLKGIPGIYVNRYSGKHLVAITTAERHIRIPHYVDVWDEDRHKKLLSLKFDVQIKKVAFSADGNYLAVTDGLGLIRIYTIKDGVERSRIQRNESVETLAFIDGDRYILSATGPSEYYPAVLGSNTIQLDVWKTDDLVRIGCRALGIYQVDDKRCNDKM